MKCRRGMSLLEVILSLAILAGALATLGEVIRSANRSAAEARDLALAQLHCETTLAEVTAGILPAETTGPAPIEIDSNWLYTVEAGPIDNQGLFEVRVTVSQDPALARRPVSFSLVRWIPDPSIQLPAETESPDSSTSSATGQTGSASTTGNATTP